MKERVKDIIDNIKKFVKTHKKLCIIVLCAVLIIAIIGLYLGFKKSKQDNKEETSLTSMLEDMGADFYENSYYNQLGDDEEIRNKFLEKYSKVGIKIDLENLGRIANDKNDKIVAKFVNPDNDQPCNKKETKVIIYPVSPYGKTDYKLETIISCDGTEEEQEDPKELEEQEENKEENNAVKKETQKKKVNK